VCLLQDAEVRMDCDSAIKAHAEALRLMDQFPDPASLFKRPNPWTSPIDFSNEKEFINRWMNFVALGSKRWIPRSMRWLRYFTIAIQVFGKSNLTPGDSFSKACGARPMASGQFWKIGPSNSQTS
jgi:hypothetical protein